MVIELIKINKKIDSKNIIKDLSLTIKKGQVFALLGPNGAGKTTLIRIILGLLKPDSGDIKLCNVVLNSNNRSDLLLNIGVQNDGNLYEELTVIENLSIWGSIYNMDKNIIKNRIIDISKIFGLDEYLKMPVGNLSKGNRQKVLLARAIFHKPDILILDEPTSGLDPKAIDEFYDLIKKLKKDSITIIMCTHYLYGMDNVIDSLGIIKDGILLTSGDLEELRDFDSKINFLGEFNEYDIEQLKKFGSIEGNIKNNFFITLKDESLLPIIIKELILKNNNIHEIIKCRESIKDIYFKIINNITIFITY